MAVIINTVGKDLEKYKEKILRQIRDEIAMTADELEDAAYRDLTAGSSRPDLIEEFKGQGLNFIQIQKTVLDKGFRIEVGPRGNDPMPAYIEFGTGLSAKEILAPYPEWIKDIAWTFKKKTDGTLQGNPYLYNNYLRLMPGYKKRLKELLDKKYKS